MIRLVPPKFRQDYELALNEPLRFRSIWRILTQASWLMIYFGRLGEARWAGLARFLFLLMSRRRGIEMKYSSRIGGGVVLGHAYGITVNSKVVIEGNCLLFKGSTLGDIRTGKRKGVPKLRRFVVVGLNATICGGVTIGNDVFIARVLSSTLMCQTILLWLAIQVLSMPNMVRCVDISRILSDAHTSCP